VQALETVLGVVVYFLLMSLIATAIVEIISSLRRTRGRVLLDVVRTACGGGETMRAAIYRHHLIAPLCEAPQRPSPEAQDGPTARAEGWLLGKLTGMDDGQRRSLPSYIPAESFSRALLETVLGGALEDGGDLGVVFAAPTRSWKDPRVNEEAGGAPAVEPGNGIGKDDLDAAYGTLRPLVKAAKGDAATTLKLVGVEFSRVNDRAKGWYKRKLARYLLYVGLLLAIATNGDATRVVARLTSDPALRTALTQQAEILLAQEAPKRVQGAVQKPTKDSREELLRRGRIVEGISGGWATDPLLGQEFSRSGSSVWVPLLVFKLLGLLMTAGAVSLGAPFWYDVLNKLVKLRSSSSSSAATEPDGGDSEEGKQKRTEEQIADAIAALNAKVSIDQLRADPRTLALGAEMAAFSELSYESMAVIQRQLPKLGFPDTKVAFISKRSTGGLGLDTQVCVARTPERLIVAFRGTELRVLHDIITDAALKPMDIEWAQACTPKAKAHQGFVLALELVWQEVIAAIDELNGTDSLPVFFCGHSLGGALAVLAAARYLSDVAVDEDDGSRRKPGDLFGGVYTVGQPRVGNQVFADWAGRLFGGRYARGVNNRDIVPRIPPPRLGSWEYAHFGTVHLFDSHGHLWIDPSWFLRLLDYALPEEDVREIVKQPVADHAVTDYVRLYGKASSPTPA